MTEEMPLHVRVALALGYVWAKHLPDVDSLHPGARFVTRKVNQWSEPADGSEPLAVVGDKPAWADVPRFDTDWAATGPLIERLGISVRKVHPSYEKSHGRWEAEVGAVAVYGETALLAVCELILKLPPLPQNS